VTATLRLVVADDDPDVLTALVALLEELGYVVAATATDGAAAVAAALREQPEVVLLDVRMPVLSGLEAAAQLRERAPQLPLVLLTAYADQALQAEARALGVRGFLVKGCSARAIVAALDAAVA
jgi:CheY-like chemotaxis protein